MGEQPADPWRAAVEVTEAAATAREARPELVTRLDAAAGPFRSAGSDVAGLLDDVDRRAVIDVDAPLASSRPVVPQLKGAVRKSVAFVSRHLAQQTGVLVGGLSAAVRLLDQRVQRLEPTGLDAVAALLPDLRGTAAALDPIADRVGGVRRDVGRAAELDTLPLAGADLVVGYGLVDVGPLTTRLHVLDRLVGGLAPGGWLAIVAVPPSAWAGVDPVAQDLGAPGPLRAVTWAHLLQARGGLDVEVHEDADVNVVAAHW